MFRKPLPFFTVGASLPRHDSCVGVREMTPCSGEMQTFSAEGQIVELLEKQSRRFVKVVFTVPIQLDVTEDGVDDMHLGDRVVVHGWLGIEKENV